MMLLIQRIALSLSKKHMSKEDIFVVGFPRSGNFWVARLLKKTKVANPHDISFAEIAQEYGYDVCSRSRT